ncbi:MAG TPA: hypothetical protein VL171_00295 [Verrucomicrobiae bacterium]|nr:hypothetical protein [Verrucomicrobiae bacterium]
MKPSPKLPQPRIFEEIRAMRQKVHSKAQKLGWERFVADINQRVGHLLGKPVAPAPRNLRRKRSPLRPVAGRSSARRRSSLAIR